MTRKSRPVSGSKTSGSIRKQGNGRSCLFAIPLALSLVLAGTLVFASPVSAARAPAGKTYFFVSVGLFTAHEVDVGCMRFTRSRLCFEGGPCGSWERVRDDADTSALRFEVSFPSSGLEAEISGELSLDERGSGSALGGSGRLGYAGSELNFSLAGRVAGRRECRRLASDFQEGLASFDSAQCLRRARFGPPASSAYVLPYEIGSSYNVSQSYCDRSGASHRSKFAYDLDLPMGAPVLAARDGVVWSVVDEFQDGDRDDTHVNNIMVEHDDGSVALYAHIGHRSSLVAPGDRVVAGQTIAAGGNSGDRAAWPHLHFQVQKSRSQFEDESVPVNFRNAEGPLDERGGLIPGVSYRALSW